MTAPEDLKNKPRLSYKRDRFLTAKTGEIKEPVRPLPSEVQAETFDLLDRAGQKADVLMDAIQRALVTLTVPVKEEHTEIRAAVRRKDEASGGAFITFDLYLRALKFEADAFELSPGEVAQLMIGHRFTDGRRLQALSLQKAGDMSEEDSILAASQIMHLYILQLMQMGLQAIESEKQTSTKVALGSDAGKEVAPMTASVIFSIAFQLAYSANLAKDLFDVMQESSTNALRPSQVNLPVAFEEAKKLKLPELRALKLALKSKEPEDFELIRTYATAFVRRTRKIGYEPWLLAENVFRLQRELRRATQERVRYTTSGLQLHNDFARVLQHQAKQSSRLLDYIAEALTQKYSDAELICSMLWMLRTHKEPIAMMKALLEFLLAKLLRDLDNVAIPPPSMDESIIDKILHEVAEAIQKINKRMVGWFNTDNEAWDALIQCSPIGDAINASLLAIERIEQEFYDKLESKLGRMRSFSSIVQSSSQAVAEMKRVKMFLAEIRYTEARMSAADSDTVVRELRGGNRLSGEVFGGAPAIDLGANAGLFEKVAFKSEFMGNISGAGETPGHELTVPWDSVR